MNLFRQTNQAKFSGSTDDLALTDGYNFALLCILNMSVKGTTKLTIIEENGGGYSRPRLGSGGVARCATCAF